MATQSLYRRYRPRRFSELKGQDHIVRALRTSVAEGREGQAYLFSGPRGTGKTTTARIMAKVLNCEKPQDGEPCCECASCLSVEQGTSYDVHELDAASNNGVEAMRDLIDKASLGTPGRHKVYILDEVHMLSKGAEAALLKTLEEPPPHVVFVLATTDPQKMSDTIRSRTQHLQFHLLGADTLDEHVRWVASDAGLTVSDDAIEQVIAQGAGSPRDTLSALELVSNSGGAATEIIALDEFVEAMIEHDPGRGLKMVAQSVSQGRDPRTITEELIGYLRNGFLALMAPELVQLPSHRLDAVTDVAQRAGAVLLVRGIEQLGEALVEMRTAPDPRVLLDVATVRLTAEEVSDDVAALATRLQRLERKVADGVPAAPAAATSSGTESAAAMPPATAPPREVDPSTGRRKLGSRAGASAPAATDGAAAHAGAAQPPSAPPAASDDPQPTSSVAESGPASRDPAGSPTDRSTAETPAPAGAGKSISDADWETVRPQLRGMARAVFSPATFVSVDAGTVTLGLPNETHRTKCEQHRDVVEQALAAHAGVPISVDLVVDGDGGGGGSRAGSGPGGSASGVEDADVPRAVETSGPSTASPSGSGAAKPITTGALAEDRSPSAEHDPVPSEDTNPSQHLHVVQPAGAEAGDGAAVRNGRAIADQARTDGPPPDPDEGLQRVGNTLPDDDDVDLDDLIDAPPESVKSPVDRLAEAFPGSELVDDPY
ncbi:DNA polymerase III subunit gamma/tau [Ilumatobacter nonamiensis]|uniref:DNA polymerase III subunit gamma/tau n=1 Tax=Ilumatobacter nonamiensis TaxID=467093 RepID=UPI0006884D05|nr:DNA polymerase III subunit gamma/tau [Ilumatobacter nonamiensis]